MTQPERQQRLQEVQQFSHPNSVMRDEMIERFVLLASMAPTERRRALAALPAEPLHDVDYIHATLQVFRFEVFDITELHESLIHKIFTHLPTADLACWQQVNKSYRAIAQNALRAELRIPREARAARRHRLFYAPLALHAGCEGPTSAVCWRP